jgi:N-acetyl-anhydromuramyl-L-alanine amidase AmpD
MKSFDPDCPVCGGSGYVDYYTAHLDQSVGQTCDCALIHKTWEGDRWDIGDRVVPAKFHGPSLVREKVTRFVVHCGASDNPHIERYFQHPWEGDRYRVVSAHFVVTDEGTVIQCVPANRVAWHARGANYDSLGAELVGPPTRNNWPGYAIVALAAVIKECIAVYPGIDTVTSHRALAPLRRTDPGPNFPWDDLEHLLSGKLLRFIP